MKNIVYTNTLPPDVMKWITETSKRLKTSKKQIILNALENYRDQMTKNELATSFQRASRDPEMDKMAEEGLADFHEQLKKL